MGSARTRCSQGPAIHSALQPTARAEGSPMIGSPHLDPLAVDGRESARICGVSRSTWMKLCASGRTPRPVRLGRRVVWPVSVLHEWLVAGSPSRERWEAMRRAAQ